MLSIPTKYLEFIKNACWESAANRRLEGNASDAVALEEAAMMLATMFRDGVERYELRAVDPDRAEPAP